MMKEVRIQGSGFRDDEGGDDGMVQVLDSFAVFSPSSSSLVISDKAAPSLRFLPCGCRRRVLAWTPCGVSL
jgi:hypothetical protein